MIKKIKNYQRLLLLLVILLGLFIRIYRLDQNLPNLYSDEVYVHYSMWVYLTHFSNNPLSFLLNYLTLGSYSFSWLLGLTPLAVRLPAALYGTLLIFISYIFTFTVSNKLGFVSKKSYWISLISAILTAFSPWSFMLSRIGYSHIGLMLIFSLLFLTLLIKAETVKNYLLSLIPLFIAAYYYQSMLILGVVGIIICTYFILKKKGVTLRYVGLGILLFALLAFLANFIFYRYAGISVQSRGSDLAIWRDPNNLDIVNQFRVWSRQSNPTFFTFNTNPEILNKIFYNKLVATFDVFTKNYLSFFSPDFLFLKGDPVVRHSTQQTGELLIIYLPFLLIGVVKFFSTASYKLKIIFLSWIIFSPIPAALTNDGYQYLLRVITIFPVLCCLTAFGSISFIDFVPRIYKKMVIAVLLFLLTVNIYYFLFGYFQAYSIFSARSFDFGFGNLAIFQKEHQNQSMLVIWDGYYPHYHFRFWQQTPADQFLNFTPNKILIDQTEYDQMFSNLFFGVPKTETNLSEFINSSGIKFIALPAKYKIQYKDFSFVKPLPLKIIIYPDNSEAFLIYNIK